MHGYIGNANNDPQTVQVLDDSDSWTATIVNTPTQSLADSNAYLRSRLNRSSNNWPQPISPWSGTQVSSGSMAALAVPPIWDPVYGRWMAMAIDGGTLGYLIESYSGYAWDTLLDTSTVTGPSAVGMVGGWGIIGRQVDGAVLLVGQNRTSGSPIFSTYVCTPSGTTRYDSQPWTAPATGCWYSGGYSTISNVWVVWQGGSSIFVPQWSADGHTWANATTWSPPASFQVHNLARLELYTGAGVSLFGIFPAGTTVVTAFMASTDGKNWTSYAMPVLAAGESVVDVAYDAFTSTIYLATVTGGGVTHIWSSSPLALGTWSLVSIILHQSYAIRANGREIVLWISYPKGFTSGTIYKGIVSTDATTWLQMPGLNATLAPGNNFCLKSNGSQFFYCNVSNYAASGFVGVPAVLSV